MFPNPANDVLNLTYTLKTKTNIQIDITDALGKTNCSQNTTIINEGENTSAINTSLLKPGVYFLQMKQNGAVIYSSKFIKQGAN